MPINLEGNTDYIIFFDDQHIQRFVTSFSVTTSVTNTIGEAYIECIYAKALMDIPYMTDVKIFVKNVFNGRYKMVFDGQIHSRQINISSGSKQIAFTAYDHMYWLQKLPVPLILGLEASLDDNIILSWVARGINTDRVQTILTTGEMAFAGRNMRETIKQIFMYVDDALTYSPDYGQTEANSIYKWINIKDKIKLLSDFDPRLRDNSLIDLFYQGSIVENLYVLLSGISSGIGYEFYQDTDGIIKIKEPFWHQGVIKPFAIDANLILDFNESCAWDNKPTRVLVTGGIEEFLQDNVTDGTALDIHLPSALYIHDDAGGRVLTDEQGYTTEVTEGYQNFIKDYGDISEDEVEVRKAIVNCGLRYLGVPYVLGGGHPYNKYCNDGLDCSGLVYYAYRDAGLSLPSSDTFGYYGRHTRISVSALQPGDMAFKNFSGRGPEHMGMYIGKNAQTGKYMYLHASGNRTRPGDPGNPRYDQRVVVHSYDTKQGTWEAFCNALPALKRGMTSYTPTFNLPQGKVFKSTSTSLTNEEKQRGINLVETVQKFIRIQHVGESFPKAEAYKILGDYAKYLHTALSASSVVASLTTIAAPWLRPGLNVWIDPNGISRFYYVNSVRHSGNNGVVYTNLGLTYGRSEKEFVSTYNSSKDNAVNPLTAEVLATTKDFYLENGAGASAFNYITPENITVFKEYVNKVWATCADKGSIPAHLSPYKDWYGEAFVRRNTDVLGRWDSDFNLFELYCIIAASYGIQDIKNLPSLNSAPNTGSINSTDRNNRYVSDFARFAINYDLNRAGHGGTNVPGIIKDRAKQLANIVVAADKEISHMYSHSNINKDYTR